MKVTIDIDGDIDFLHDRIGAFRKLWTCDMKLHFDLATVLQGDYGALFLHGVALTLAMAGALLLGCGGGSSFGDDSSWFGQLFGGRGEAPPRTAAITVNR